MLQLERRIFEYSKLFPKLGELKLKSILRVVIFTLSLTAILWLGMALAENENMTKENNATNITDLEKIVLQLQNVTLQLQNVTLQLLEAARLQNETQQLDNVSLLKNATDQLQNATDKLQSATDPFAGAKGKRKPGGPR